MLSSSLVISIIIVTLYHTDTNLVINLLEVFYMQRLYDLGARKIIIMDIGPIGCVPTFARDVKFKLNNNATCDEDINDAVSHFNILLASTLQKLASNLPNSHFILGHGYNSLYDAVLNPAKYGMY